MKKVLNYPYPVKAETINSFVQNIHNAVEHSQCTTFSKGLRAWFRFSLISFPDKTTLVEKLKPYYTCYFEIVDVLEYSKLGFFYQLLKILDLKTELKYEESSLFKIIAEIELTISHKLDDHKKIVIFIPKLNAFPDFNYEYGNILYKIWRQNKEHILFVISFSGVNVYEYAKDKCGEFKEAVLQNVIKIDKLSDEDIAYSIKHWCEILDVNLYSNVTARIIKLSDGSASISKMLVQTCTRQKSLDEKSLLLYLEETIEKYIKLSFPSILKLDAERIFLDDMDISLSFTGTEYQILKTLLSNPQVIISREEIATTIWGNQSYEKYSDWAIDKFISQIRSKLSQHRFKGELKTFRNRGFKVILPKADG